MIASSGSDNLIIIWNITTGAQKAQLVGHSGSIYSIQLISSNILASLSNDKTIKMWSTTDWSLIQTVSTQSRGEFFYSLDLVDCSMLVSGGSDGYMKFWNATSNFNSLVNSVDSGSYIRALSVFSKCLASYNSKQCSFTIPTQMTTTPQSATTMLPCNANSVHS